MALNKREHTLALVGGTALGLFVIYYLISILYLDPRAKLDDSIKKANKDLQTGKTKIATAAKDEKIWPNLGILDFTVQDPETGENAVETMGALVSDAYTLAARNSGIGFTGLFNNGVHSSPGRTDFMEVRFNAQTNTTTARLARFLYAVETNNVIPARIETLKVNTVKPGLDDLHVDMVISTLIYNPKVPIPSPKGTATRSSATTPALAGRVTTTAPLDEAAMQKLTDELMARRAADLKKAEDAATKAATQPKKTPEEMEAEMVKRRAEEEKAAAEAAKTQGAPK